MIKCKVFKTDWNSPELHSAVRAFNSFCLDNPDIEVIKIDTVTVGQDNGDVNIYLYYNKKEPTTSVHIDVKREFKKEDLVYYNYNGEEVIAKIIQTDPVIDKVTISFFADGAKCQAQISFKAVSFVPDSIDIRNFKPGDNVIYRSNCKEYSATILRTYRSTCIIKYHNNIVETNYLYIDKVEEI